MLARIREAFLLFAERWGMISVIVLTVWIPGNIFMDLLIRAFAWDENLLRQYQVSVATGLILDPLVAAAVIYVVYQSRIGAEIHYRDAMAFARHRWWSVFVTRILAAARIFIGLILLIVPGILLSLRWTLIDPVVVVEGIDSSDALRRSSELPGGRQLQIFASLALLFVASLLLMLVLTLPPVLHPFFDNPVYGLVSNCANDLFAAVGAIVLTLYFLESTENEPPPAGEELPADGDSGRTAQP